MHKEVEVLPVSHSPVQNQRTLLQHQMPSLKQTYCCLGAEGFADNHLEKGPDERQTWFSSAWSAQM